jgi:hypothetical protein
MNRNYVWKVILVTFLTALCIAGMYPPVGKNLVQVFKQRAVNRDATFTNIITKAEQLEKEFPARTFANLHEAVGTNYITNYFPAISVAGKKDPNAPRAAAFAAGHTRQVSTGAGPSGRHVVPGGNADEQPRRGEPRRRAGSGHRSAAHPR